MPLLVTPGLRSLDGGIKFAFAPHRFPPMGAHVHTLGTMTPEPGSPDVQSSEALKTLLRRIFDSQIPNYGDYNLVCATPAPGSSTYYVMGYRWRPAELVFAPFSPGSFESIEPPTAVNTTNLSHADEVGPGSYEVGTTTGRIFRFGVEPEAKLSPGNGGAQQRVLQEADQEDFNSFLDTFLELA